MKKFFSFVAMSAIVILLSSCGTLNSNDSAYRNAYEKQKSAKRSTIGGTVNGLTGSKSAKR